MGVHDSGLDRMLHFGHGRERHALSGHARPLEAVVVEPQDHVLRGNDDRRAVGGRQNVVGRHHQDARFKLRFKRKRDVHRHLVAVEIGVERRADQRMELDGLAFDEHGLESLDPEPVQSRSAVEKDGVLTDHFVENVPNLLLLLLHKLLRLLDRGREIPLLELRVDERLEQLERHFLRKAALVKLEFGTRDDHRTSRKIHALPEQILAEPALLSFQHVAQRLERPPVGAGDRLAAPSVVEQRIDRFLEHPLLVAHDDVRRAKILKPLEAVVPVDDAAVEVVQVRRRESAAVQRHQRPKLRRNDRNDGEDHPFRTIPAFYEVFDQLQPLDDFLQLLLARRVGKLGPERLRFEFEIDLGQHFPNGFRSDPGPEGLLSVAVLRVQVFFFSEKLARFEIRQSRLNHDEPLEIQDPLQVRERHVEHEPDAARAARRRFQEPDVRDGSRELDVPHPLAANLLERDLDAAFLAGDAAELHPLVFSAEALVILDRAEDPRAEQAVALRLERPVVDRLRLLDFPVGPREHLFRRRERNPDLVERGRSFLGSEGALRQFTIHFNSPMAVRLRSGPLSGWCAPPAPC